MKYAGEAIPEGKRPPAKGVVKASWTRRPPESPEGQVQMGKVKEREDARRPAEGGENQKTRLGQV